MSFILDRFNYGPRVEMFGLGRVNTSFQKPTVREGADRPETLTLREFVPPDAWKVALSHCRKIPLSSITFCLIKDRKRIKGAALPEALDFLEKASRFRQVNDINTRIRYRFNLHENNIKSDQNLVLGGTVCLTYIFEIDEEDTWVTENAHHISRKDIKEKKVIIQEKIFKRK